MKGKLIQDYNSVLNDFPYKKDEIVDITELEGCEKSYAVYRYTGYNQYDFDTADFIPKTLIKIIE